MLSKESKQVIIKQLENDLVRYKDAGNSFVKRNNGKIAASTMQHILKLEKALKELRDV